MGRHIIRATRWSCRSLLRVYSRTMTLLFALFCAATGQLPKTASAKQAEATQTVFKGKALRASDSTVLGNIRLYLQDCFLPDYGIVPDYGIAPEYGVAPLYGVSMVPVANLAETTTDANGNFEVPLSVSTYAQLSVSSEVVTEAGSNKSYYSPGCYTIQKETDSTYTLYLRNVTTETRQTPGQQQNSVAITARHGTIVQIRVPDLIGKSASVSVVTTSGRKIATIAVDGNGMLQWDTRSTVKGVYFLKAEGEFAGLHMKILVK